VSVMGGIWWHYFERTSPLQTPGQRCRSFSATCFNLAKLLSDVFTLSLFYFHTDVYSKDMDMEVGNGWGEAKAA